MLSLASKIRLQPSEWATSPSLRRMVRALTSDADRAGGEGLTEASLWAHQCRVLEWRINGPTTVRALLRELVGHASPNKCPSPH
jgi:hypothetical protein